MKQRSSPLSALCSELAALSYETGYVSAPRHRARDIARHAEAAIVRDMFLSLTAVSLLIVMPAPPLQMEGLVGLAHVL